MGSENKVGKKVGRSPKGAAEERCLFAGTSAQKNNFKPNKYYILKTLCWCVSSHFDEDLELH